LYRGRFIDKPTMYDTLPYDPKDVRLSSCPCRLPWAEEKGFSLVEILVALAVIGILVVMLGTLINSVGRNSVLLREGDYPLEESVALRRVLHRDIQSMSIANRKSIAVIPNGFRFTTSNTLLHDSPLDVTVTWIFSEGKIQRREENQELAYSRTVVLYTKLSSWGLEFFDQGRNIWTRATVAEKVGVRALRLTLTLDGSEPLKLVERVS
jgi:prepilin-type N-terminal cleavage/methylation domain-containing protein